MIARHLLVLIALASCAWATSCTFDEKANASKGCGNCPAGMCYFGFCVAPSPGSPGAGGSGGVQPGGGAGGDRIATGTSGQSAGNGGTGVTSGMSGGAGTTPGGAGGNSGGGGGSTPTGMCPDQRTPEAESCNGKDDDCDGKTDEDLTLGSCAGTNSNGCGGVMRCQGGKTVCDANAGPTTEICNGLDDDCDGVVDNNSDVPCYPDGQTGCTKNAAGSYDCKGSCKAGMALCQSGKLAACADFVTPTAEQCGQAEAADEDCNGMVDDGCPCSGNQTQGCYSGPALTRRVGTCKAGTQHCVNSVFGPCQGEVTPVGESCSNEGADDDCNGFRDDIFLRGVFCVAFAAQGACASGSYGCTGSDYVCQPGAAQAKETSCDQVDEDCDGKTDEDFDFDTDPNNCGSCGNKCAAGNLCCGGTCRDIGSDAQHCGSCARVCGTDTLCCAGDCVATNTNMHCGSCTGCSGGQTCCGGSCMTTGAAAPCGTCNPCAGTDLCCNGQCVPSGAGTCNACTPCPSDQLCCSGMCITPAADAGAVCP